MNITLNNFVSSLDNAQKAKLDFFIINKSIFVSKIVDLLIINGYLKGYQEIEKNKLKIYLKYSKNTITSIKIISKPGKKVYLDYNTILKKFNYNDFFIVSTNYGLLTNKELNFFRIGGEVILKIK